MLDVGWPYVSKNPSTMKVMISISRCGCSPNPDGQRSLASLCPVHSSYIKYKRWCKLKLLCTNLIFYIWSTSFVVVCIWVCLWKHVTDLTRIKMNTKPIAHHGSSFTLHQVIVHHPQNTKGARPFTVLCKVEMKSRLQPVLVGPSLAQNCWKLKWFDIQKLWIFWLPIFGICQKNQTDEPIFTCDLVSEGFWALPNHRGSGSLTSDWIFMVTIGDIPVTSRENFDALTSESQKAKHL